MFWKFGFQPTSSIDSLLDRDDVSLEAILDEDDLLQECKSQNTKLINYFQRVDVLERLLGYVSGQIEGEEKGRFKYPYVATEVLCSEIWSIVETCITHSNELLQPFWDHVLSITSTDMRSRISLASHFVKINAVFLSKKPDEMFGFIQSVSSVVDKLLDHIESPPFVDLIFRILQLDEQPGNMGVIQWFSSEKLIPRLIALLSPDHSPELHIVAADFLKGIIALSSPSPTSFSMNASNMSVDSTGGLPISNRLAREIAHKDNVAMLTSFMLVEVADEQTTTRSHAEPARPDDPIEPGSSATERAASSLVNIIPVFIELIRKNNSDFFEPYLFHALRNRLIQIRQHQQYTDRAMTEEGNREELEAAMNEIVEHMGLVHLGSLLETAGNKLEQFQELLKKPRSSLEAMSTTTGAVVPLTFERFRICELYAEILHCSNMTLLNRTPGVGPQYDDEGRLLGGLTGLEELAKVVSNTNDNDSAAQSEEEDPAYALATIRDQSSTPHAMDTISIGSSGSSTDDGVGSDGVEEVLEEVHFDDEDPASSITLKLPPQPAPAPLTTKQSETPDPKSSTMANGSQPESPTAPLKLSELTIKDENAMDVDQVPSVPSPVGSDKTVIKPEVKLGNSAESSSTAPSPGDVLKQRFLDLGVISSMLDLFFEFPLNNFLHNVVYDLLHQVLTGRIDRGLNRQLVVSLFSDTKILQRIIDGQRRNDEECSKPKGYRAGYMGHLTLISEDIVSAFEQYPQDLISILSMHAPRREWDQYVSGKYKETKEKDTSQLGGGKPALGLALQTFGSGSLASRKVDEGDEIMRDASTEAIPADSSEQAVDTSSSPFARYLVQQMVPQEQSSSNSSDNSSDEDDGAWLDAANRNFQFDESGGDFELGPAPSADLHRRTGSGFDDAFDPSSVSIVNDPFGGDSDEEEGAWGPFSDTNVARDATDSVSSSFTFSSTSDDDTFNDSFGDDFGDFQTATTVEVTAAFEVDEAGGRTPTAANNFQFDDDFGTDRESGSTRGGAAPAEGPQHVDRQPLPAQTLDTD